MFELKKQIHQRIWDNRMTATDNILSEMSNNGNKQEGWRNAQQETSYFGETEKLVSRIKKQDYYVEKLAAQLLCDYFVKTHNKITFDV